MRAIIVAGGKLDKVFAEELLSAYPDAVTIAADKGCAFFIEKGMKADYVIGDFDSLDEDLKTKIDSFSKNVKILNPIKDATDTEEAIDLALKLGCQEILVLGAIGGNRLDHLLGNLSLLDRARVKGFDAKIKLLDSCNRIQLLGGGESLEIEKEKQFGKYVSVIPFGDECKDVCLEGFFYNLENATLTKGNTLGISNEIVEKEALISVGRGQLIVVESRD